MRKIALCLAAILVAVQLQAQFKSIGEGPEFEEPEKGFSKIVLMKNGSTAFLHVTLKDGINVRIYDDKRKEKAVKHYEPQYGKLKGGNIDGAFEINGDLVVLISEVDGRTPILYRLIIDGKSGTVKKEEQIAELKRVSFGAGYAIHFGGVPMPDFCIRKDPNSDNYALCLFNSLEADRNKRIELVHYGSDHKEISRAFYNSPNDKYKYMQYIDMAVMGKERVSVLANAYNTAASGGKESELVIANVEAGSKSITLKELKAHANMVVTGGIMRYNYVTKKMVLLSTAKETAKSKSQVGFIATFDPLSLAVNDMADAYPNKANEKSLEIFGRKNPFNGMPQNLFINDDGSCTVVYEEIAQQVVSSSTHSHLNSTLGHIAVVVYSPQLKEVSTAFIPKSHKINDTKVDPFYHSVRDGAAQQLDFGNQFKSFAYLNGKGKKYILFNDIEKNGESSMNGKLTTIQGVSDCDGFYFDLKPTEIMPTRNFVFGATDSKRDHNFALFTISDYNRESNVYVTLKVEKQGRGKGVKVVWLQPGI